LKLSPVVTLLFLLGFILSKKYNFKFFSGLEQSELKDISHEEMRSLVRAEIFFSSEFCGFVSQGYWGNRLEIFLLIFRF